MGILEEVPEAVVPAVAPVVEVDVSEDEDEAPDSSVFRRGIPLILPTGQAHSAQITSHMPGN